MQYIRVSRGEHRWRCLSKNIHKRFPTIDKEDTIKKVSTDLRQKCRDQVMPNEKAANLLESVIENTFAHNLSYIALWIPTANPLFSCNIWEGGWGVGILWCTIGGKSSLFSPFGGHDMDLIRYFQPSPIFLPGCNKNNCLCGKGRNFSKVLCAKSTVDSADWVSELLFLLAAKEGGRGSQIKEAAS